MCTFDLGHGRFLQGVKLGIEFPNHVKGGHVHFNVFS
jgi:hypothetical protein